MRGFIDQGRVILVLLTLLFCQLAGTPSLAETIEPVTPGPQDRCPVCGMFTAPFPDSVSQIIFRDGSYLTFDGPKDLFRYFLSPARYLPQEASKEIKAVFVKDYYSLTPIDARSAWFVIGSDVFGPMGKELIPFARQEDASGFLQDHHGRAVLGFGEITAEVLRELD